MNPAMNPKVEATDTPRAKRRMHAVTLGCALFASAWSSWLVAGTPTAAEQVFATERAFAKTMADRDLQGFAGFLSDEAVFFAGTTPLRGKQTVVEAWTDYYAGPQAPFSWEPDQVEVLDSGTLAWSTGPVRNPEGTIVRRFHSVWRLEAPGVWRIVFDRGSPPSPGPEPVVAPPKE